MNSEFMVTGGKRTQEVAGTIDVAPPVGGATEAKQDTIIASIEDIGVTTDVKVTLDGETVPVTGTFYQATQPVSIASMPSTPVTGTFWQATQPVSGTFYQATQPVSIAATVTVQDSPVTSGGLSKFHLVGAATTNATNVKASAGQVYAITAFNIAATPAYLKFHNTAGTPTAGAGVTETFLIPGNTAGAGLAINFDKGITFATGIGITLVTGIADASAVAIAADNVVVNIYYK